MSSQNKGALNRLNTVNNHMKVVKAKKKAHPTLNVWEHMNLDQYLTEKGADCRKRVSKVMSENIEELNQHFSQAKFPFFMLEKISETGVNGLTAGPEYGGPGLSFHDMGAICYEMARRDASFSTGFYVHNLTIYTILLYGNEEQRQRLLPPYINFEKMASFGLTEPAYGSFATGLQTTATKVEGGYVLNGEKYWIGNGTLGDCMVWARNEADDGKIQAFVVDGRSEGFYAKTIQDKIALRSVQNAHIKLENVFVPENNRLANVTNFEDCTQVLTHSRLIVAWKASGIAAGAYEAALKYTLEREQFFRPIAQFQLVQEKLSRMLALCEAMISQCLVLSHELARSKEGQEVKVMGRVSRAKAITSKLGREIVALAREVCGGNGIILSNHVMKAFVDMEAIYTYEGTYDINMLVSGRELTGGLFAFK